MAVGCYHPTLPGGVVVTEAFHFGASYSWCTKENTFYHFEMRYLTDDIYLCICIYVCVIYYTLLPRFFIVYINPVTMITFYIITFYSMLCAFDAIMFLL